MTEDENSELWIAARPLAAMPPARASLAGTRLDLHGADGKLCTVTVGQPTSASRFA